MSRIRRGRWQMFPPAHAEKSPCLSSRRTGTTASLRLHARIVFSMSRRCIRVYHFLSLTCRRHVISTSGCCRFAAQENDKPESHKRQHRTAARIRSATGHDAGRDSRFRQAAGCRGNFLTFRRRLIGTRRCGAMSIPDGGRDRQKDYHAETLSRGDAVGRQDLRGYARRRDSQGALCAPENLLCTLQETNALLLLKPEMLLRVGRPVGVRPPFPRANPSKWDTRGGCRFGRSARL
jgi:nitroreductase